MQFLLNVENDVNMRNIYTENTNGYLMHLCAVLAEAGEGVEQWSYKAASQVDPLVHTIATSESGTGPVIQTGEGSRPIYLFVGYHRTHPT